MVYDDISKLCLWALTELWAGGLAFVGRASAHANIDFSVLSWTGFLSKTHLVLVGNALASVWADDRMLCGAMTCRKCEVWLVSLAHLIDTICVGVPFYGSIWLSGCYWYACETGSTPTWARGATKRDDGKWTLLPLK